MRMGREGPRKAASRPTTAAGLVPWPVATPDAVGDSGRSDVRADEDAAHASGGGVDEPGIAGVVGECYRP